MEWTKDELEKLYVEMNKKAMTDPEFRKAVLENANQALEKLAGKKLPDGFKVKVIENDPAYSATFVLPDLLSEELSETDLESVSGGIGIFFAVSACAAAIGVAGCPADACMHKTCLADFGCAAEACKDRYCGEDWGCAAVTCTEDYVTNRPILGS